MPIDPTSTTPTAATIADAVQALTALGAIPGKKKKKTPPQLTEQSSSHSDADDAWAWEDLNNWPRNPPIESLHLSNQPPEGIGGENEEPSIKSFMSWANFGNAIGTWNVRDEEGEWAAERGQWLIVHGYLTREEDEDDGVGVAIACWKVAEGHAVFITTTGAARERIPAVMGMAWPATWKTESIWYGE